MGAKGYCNWYTNCYLASSLVSDVLNYTLDYFGDSLNPISKLKVGKRERYHGSLNEQQKEMMI